MKYRLSLPKKPSELIRVALKDLRRAERQKKKYVIDMDVWHEPNGKCAVCLAGACMTRVLPPDVDYVFGGVTFSEATSRSIRALNCLRCGDVEGAYAVLRRRKPEAIPETVTVAEYRRNKDKFYRDMRKLATLLAKHGE